MTHCAIGARYTRLTASVRVVGLVKVGRCFGPEVAATLQRTTFGQRIQLLKLLFPDRENGCSEEFQVLKEEDPERLAALLNRWIIAGTIWSSEALTYAT